MAQAPNPLPFSGIGYRYGLSQPTQVLTLSLQLPPAQKGAAQRIDDWLRHALDMELEADPMPVTAPGVQLAQGAGQLAWRTLLLAGELLRILRVPAFDPGCILSLQAERGKPGAWRLTAAVPLIELLPRAVYQPAFSIATRVVPWMLQTPRTPSSTQALYGQLTQKLLDPLKDGIPAGKSTIPILQAAHAQRVPFRHLGGGIYQLGWGCNARRIDRGAVDLDSSIGASLSHDKFKAAWVLRAAGLPAPQHRMVGSEDAALEAARALGWPLVVKPVDRDRGEGVTVNIVDEAGLRAACREALSLSRRILVERQAAGVCHRLHVAAGALLAVSKRLPKSVKGDGRHTVAELIRQANEEEARKPPWNRLKPFPDDALAQASLAAAGLSLQSIPEEGRWAPLRPIQSVAWGGVVEDFLETIHPDNVELALRATAVLGLSSAGVDVISTDIRRPWHENGAIVNEVNFAPQTTPSRENRRMLPAFLERYCPAGGRIPVEAVLGGAGALQAAKARQQALLAQGLRCHLVSHDAVLSPDGSQVALAGSGLFDHCEAMLMRADVAALVVAVQTDEWLDTGLPFDRLDRVTVLDEPLLDLVAAGPGGEPERRTRLARWLRAAQQPPHAAPRQSAG